MYSLEISLFLNMHIPHTWIISQQDKPNPYSSAWKRSAKPVHSEDTMEEKLPPVSVYNI